MSNLLSNWLFWSLLSAIFAGLTAILAKVGVEGVDSHLATAIRTTVILVFTWALAAMLWQPGMITSLSRRTWLFLTLSGFATGLSWVCYFRALQLGKASQVAPIDKLSVIFVITFAALYPAGARIVESMAGRTLHLRRCHHAKLAALTGINKTIPRSYLV